MYAAQCSLSLNRMVSVFLAVAVVISMCRVAVLFMSYSVVFRVAGFGCCASPFASVGVAGVAAFFAALGGPVALFGPWSPRLGAVVFVRGWGRAVLSRGCPLLPPLVVSCFRRLFFLCGGGGRLCDSAARAPASLGLGPVRVASLLAPSSFRARLAVFWPPLQALPVVPQRGLRLLGQDLSWPFASAPWSGSHRG